MSSVLYDVRLNLLVLEALPGGRVQVGLGHCFRHGRQQNGQLVGVAAHLDLEPEARGNDVEGQACALRIVPKKSESESNEQEYGCA